jgi:hypothetical protein
MRWSVGFINESKVIWVTVLNSFFTTMFSTLSRNSLNKGVKSLLNKSSEVFMPSGASSASL